MPCQATANLAVDIWVRAWSGLCADEIEFASLFLLLAMLGLYLVGELTHMRSMCVGVAETGIEHRSPAKILKETFSFLALLSDQKRGKSHLRGVPPLIYLSPVASRRPVRTKFPDRQTIA